MKLAALFFVLASAASAQTCEEKVEATPTFSDSKKVLSILFSGEVYDLMATRVDWEIQAVCEQLEGREKLSPYWLTHGEISQFSIDWIKAEMN